MPKVDVLLPSHRANDHLLESVKSILCQSFQDFQILVVDDSPDKSVTELLDRHFRDKKIRVIESNARTVEGALNIGLQYSGAKYIARMDQDDIALPNRFESQERYMEANPNIAILGSRAFLIDSTGRKTGILNVPKSDKSIKDSLLHLQNPMVHPTIFINRDILGEFVYPDGATYMEDLALWISLIDKARFSNIPNVLLKYRISEFQNSKNKPNESSMNELVRLLQETNRFALLTENSRSDVLEYYEELLKSRPGMDLYSDFLNVHRIAVIDLKFGSKYLKDFVGSNGLKISTSYFLRTIRNSDRKMLDLLIMGRVLPKQLLKGFLRKLIGVN